MMQTRERRREIGLRLIGLCLVYIRGLGKGSEREREAYGMLAVYRESFRREEATELMVLEAMRRRREELEGREAEAVTNSCNQYKHEPGCRKGLSSPHAKEAPHHTKSKEESVRDVSSTPAGKSIRDTLEKLKRRTEGEEPSPQHIGFKKVEPKTAAKVTEFYGGDYSDYEHSIAEKDIQHAKQRHPDLTDEDFMLIPDITENWGKMEPYPSKRKGNRVRYIKTYGNTTYILAERVGSRKKDNPRLMFTTLFLKKENN